MKQKFASSFSGGLFGYKTINIGYRYLSGGFTSVFNCSTIVAKGCRGYSTHPSLEPTTTTENSINTTDTTIFSGIVLVKQAGGKTNPTTTFLLLDALDNSIIHTNVHYGKAYYGKLSRFIDVCITQCFKKYGDRGATIYAPKYNINKLTAKRAKEHYNIELIPYIQNEKRKTVNKRAIKLCELGGALDSIGKHITQLTRKFKSKDQVNELMGAIKNLSPKLYANKPIKTILECNKSLATAKYDFKYIPQNSINLDKGLVNKTLAGCSTRSKI